MGAARAAGVGAVLLGLAGLSAGPARAETVRASRLAMGTIVGITVVTDDPAGAARVAPAIEAAYAAIEAGEAELSEWRPESATSRLAATGGPVRMTSAADRLFTFALDLRGRTAGAFDLAWRTPAATRPVLTNGPDGWSLSAPGPVDLGGVLKGWLVDRAVEALRARGLQDFLVDAAGDIRAAGSADGAHGGWLVDVAGSGGRLATVRLRDMALSTSGNAGQPGHIHDAATGASMEGARVVSVVAPTGLCADGLATALYAGGWRKGLAEAHGAYALEVAADGTRTWSRGARRVFR